MWPAQEGVRGINRGRRKRVRRMERETNPRLRLGCNLHIIYDRPTASGNGRRGSAFRPAEIARFSVSPGRNRGQSRDVLWESLGMSAHL